MKNEVKTLVFSKIKFLAAILICLPMFISCDFITKTVVEEEKNISIIGTWEYFGQEDHGMRVDRTIIFRANSTVKWSDCWFYEDSSNDECWYYEGNYKVEGNYITVYFDDWNVILELTNNHNQIVWSGEIIFTRY